MQGNQPQTLLNAKVIGLFTGLIIFVALLLFPISGTLSKEANKVIAIAVLMLLWWVTEAIPIAATALLPMILFPLLNIFSIKEASAPYSSPLVYLFMGGFIIALAMEKWNLHKRIALAIIQKTGTHANGIILGFMLATALLSMWISNTATTVMMLPIAQSVMLLFLQEQKTLSKGQRNFALALFLGVAYAANIGGVATLVGTPPNLVLTAYFENTFHQEISFARWMAIALPFSLVFLGITYLVLVKLMHPNKLGELTGSSELVKQEYAKLGRMSGAEKRVGIVFLCTALLWITRKGLQPYLSKLGITLSDPVIAMFFALLLFLIPSGTKKEKPLLAWEDTKNIPWGILILFGGGLSLANGMKETGIIALLGEVISEQQSLDSLAIVSLLLVLVLFMTEVMSNVALITVLLPVVAGIAQGMGLPPLLVCIPVTMASSCAFMLPMATPPNAIVFASGYIKVSQMVRTGLLLNVLAILLLLCLYLFGIH